MFFSLFKDLLNLQQINYLNCALTVKQKNEELKYGFIISWTMISPKSTVNMFKMYECHEKNLLRVLKGWDVFKRFNRKLNQI